jgi:hypothetical protein
VYGSPARVERSVRRPSITVGEEVVSFTSPEYDVMPSDAPATSIGSNVSAPDARRPEIQKTAQYSGISHCRAQIPSDLQSEDLNQSSIGTLLETK